MIIINNPYNGILNLIKQQNNGSSSAVVIEKIYKLVGSYYIEADERVWGNGQYIMRINLELFKYLVCFLNGV